MKATRLRQASTRNILFHIGISHSIDVIVMQSDSETGETTAPATRGGSQVSPAGTPDYEAVKGSAISRVNKRYAHAVVVLPDKEVRRFWAEGRTPTAPCCYNIISRVPQTSFAICRCSFNPLLR